MQSNSMTQTSFYEHGNTLFSDSFYCGLRDASGTLEAKIARRNDYGVWGVSVALFDYADGISHQMLVVSPTGFDELQAQGVRQEEDVQIVVAENDQEYIVESDEMRLTMVITDLHYLEDVAMPNYIFGRIRLNFEVRAK